LPIYDWRELRRWDIAESRLPRGSVVRFYEPGSSGRYTWPIVGGALICIQTLLIVGLTVNRRKRRHTETALAQLSRTLMKTEEDDRVSIAQKLHDDLGQRMVALSLEIHHLARDASDESAERVRDAGRRAGDLVGAIHALSERLHSSTLELLGLGAVVAAVCHELASELAVEIDVRQDGNADGLPGRAALALLRVLREALLNAAQHSGARHCVVRLEGRADGVELIVIDHGIGFDVDAAMRRGGVGLIGMQERMNLVNGRIALQSYPGAGTTVRAYVRRRGL
jgi:signal transduction histidine kinase